MSWPEAFATFALALTTVGIFLALAVMMHGWPGRKDKS